MVVILAVSFVLKQARTIEFMGSKLFERILLEIKGKTKFVYFHVMGEPLMHPEIGLFLDLCEKHGFRVNITTNGTLIDKASNYY